MSNIRAITGSTRIMNRNSGGGSKLQGIPSSTNLNTTAHVAFRNRNVVCPCKREYIFCMNQLGGVGAGGIPGRSYAFAPTADGTHKHFYCGHPFGFKYKNNKHIIYPKKDKAGNIVIYHNPKYFSLSISTTPSPCGQLFTTINLVEGNSYSINTLNDLVVNFTITKSCGKINNNNPRYNYYSISSVSVNNNNVQAITVIRNTIYIYSGNNIIDNVNLTNNNFTISLVQ